MLSLFKDYLGDGVEVDYNGHHIKISADNNKNVIFMDSYVLNSFLRYLERIDCKNSISKEEIKDEI